MMFWVSIIFIALVLLIWIGGTLIEGGYVRGVHFQIPGYVGIIMVAAGLAMTLLFSLTSENKRSSGEWSIEWDGRSNPLRPN